MPEYLINFNMAPVEEFAATLALAATQLVPPTELRGDLKKLGQVIKQSLRAESPVLTGYMRDHFHVRTLLQQKGAKVTISNDAPYLRFVVLGTRYQPANPFIDRALADADRQINGVVSQMGDNILRVVVKG